MLAATLAVTGATAFSTYLASNRPFLGALFEAGPGGAGVRVKHLDDRGPMARAGFQTGDVLTTVEGAGLEPHAIAAEAGLIDPDVLPRLDQFKAFLAENGRLYEHLETGRVAFTLADGTVRSVEPAPRRPLSAVLGNQEFLGASIVGSLSFLLGALIWMNRRREPAPRLLMLACLANAVTLWTAAVFWSRELALPQGAFASIMAVNHIGAAFYPSLLVSLAAIYPTQLVPWSAVKVLLAATALYWLNKQAAWIEFPFHAHMSWYAAGAVAALAGLALQWRRTRSDPVQRAQVSWVTFCMAIMIIAMLGYYVIPITMTGRTLGAAQWAAGVLTFFPFAGFALGVARYRLFDLPEWWFNASVWLLLGVLIIALQAALFYIAGFQEIGVLIYAALAAGWIYFPLRQWLSGRVFGGAEDAANAVILGYVETLSKSLTTRDIDARFAAELEDIFSPSSIRRVSERSSDVRIGDGGLSLVVPGAAPQTAFRLEAAANATRLFNRRDAGLARTLARITRQRHAQIDAIQASVNKERNRIARDLHDTVGAKLVGLIHGAPTLEVSQKARDVTNALKDTIWLLRNEGLRSLTVALSRWADEARVRTEEAGVSLEWRQACVVEIFTPAQKLISLGNILRENMTNILRHSAATWIEVVIDQPEPLQLSIKVRHNGVTNPPEHWEPGFGLKGIEERVRELDGRVEWKSDPVRPDRVEMRLWASLTEENG